MTRFNPDDHRLSNCAGVQLNSVLYFFFFGRYDIKIVVNNCLRYAFNVISNRRFSADISGALQSQVQNKTIKFCSCLLPISLAALNKSRNHKKNIDSHEDDESTTRDTFISYIA